MTYRKLITSLFVVALCGNFSLALAHPGMGGEHVHAGLVHGFLGLDHWLVALTLGLLGMGLGVLLLHRFGRRVLYASAWIVGLGGFGLIIS